MTADLVPALGAPAWMAACQLGARVRRRRLARERAADAAEMAAWAAWREAMFADLAETLDVAQAADRCGRPASTVRRWVARGLVREVAGRLRACDVMRAQYARMTTLRRP